MVKRPLTTYIIIFRHKVTPKCLGILCGQGVTGQSAYFLVPCSKETTKMFVTPIRDTKKLTESSL